jgi:hypothetical protein
LNIDEGKNRLSIGASNEAARECMAINIEASGISREATVIEYANPVRDL